MNSNMIYGGVSNQISHENNHNKKVCEAVLMLPNNTIGRVIGKNKH